jgi:hypothetical protein
MFGHSLGFTILNYWTKYIERESIQMSKCEPIIMIGQLTIHQCVTNHWCRPTKNKQWCLPRTLPYMPPAPTELTHAPCPYGAYPEHPALWGRRKLPCVRWCPLKLHCSPSQRLLFFFVMSPFWSLCYLDTSEILEQTYVHIPTLITSTKIWHTNHFIIIANFFKKYLHLEREACKCFLNEEKTWIKINKLKK